MKMYSNIKGHCMSFLSINFAAVEVLRKVCCVRRSLRTLRHNLKVVQYIASASSPFFVMLG